MKKHITIYKVGYLSHHAIWAKLALSRIVAKCNFDNGFKTVEVSENDLDETMKIIKNHFNGAEIVDISDSENEAIEYRSNYWSTTTLLNTYR